MGEMFKGPAKYPEWEGWRSWHKRIGDVMKRECADHEDGRVTARDFVNSLIAAVPVEIYLQTDVAR